MGQRANHIIGLYALYHQQRPAQGPHRFLQGGNLRGQVGGHGWAIGLILGVPFVPKRGATRVEYAGSVIRLIILHKATQHVEHAKNSPGGQALPVSQIR